MSQSVFCQEVAQRLRAMRELSGLSPEELANRTRTKVSPSYIRRLEKGIHTPTVEVLADLCGACGTTISRFFASITSLPAAQPAADTGVVVFDQGAVPEKKAKRRKAS